MGIGRFLARTLIPGYGVVKTIKDISENGLVDGVIKNQAEFWCEDNPITAIPYKIGSDDGKMEGKKERNEECSIKRVYKYIL